MTGRKKISDEQFLRDFPEYGATEMARMYGLNERAIYDRRRRLEERLGITITAPSKLQERVPLQNVRAKAVVENGSVVVFSDAHYWQDVSTAHLALLEVIKKIKPDIVVANGDMLDGATISRHPPIDWEGTPSLEDEMLYCTKRLAEVVKACPKSKRYWPLGNHDLRFNSRLQNVAPEYKGIPGLHLKDHFPDWRPCMSLWVENPGRRPVVIKHRIVGGVHAAYNNTLKSGVTTVTGHTHQLGVKSWSDYMGERFGIETGTLAEPYGVQFEGYTEDNPKNWVSGFAVLTFHDGDLLHPELVRVVDRGVYEFRGERRTVSV